MRKLSYQLNLCNPPGMFQLPKQTRTLLLVLGKESVGSVMCVLWHSLASAIQHASSNTYPGNVQKSFSDPFSKGLFFPGCRVFNVNEQLLLDTLFSCICF